MMSCYFKRLQSHLHRTAHRVAPLAAALTFFPLQAAASTAEHGGGHGHAPSILDLLPYYINFAVFLAILIVIHRKTGKPLVRSWQARWQRIEKEVGEGRHVLGEASSRHTAAQRRILEIDGHIEELQQRIKDETRRETAEILQNAEARAKQVVEQARTTGALERRAAEQQARNELVEEIIRRAAQHLQGQVTADEDRGRRQAAAGLIRELVH